MNYASASINRGNTAALDAQQTPLVLTKQNKRKTTKDNSVEAEAELDSLYCHGNVQQILEEK